MPKPRDGESEKDFVSRCIPMVMDEGTAKDNKQASAICYSMYKESKKSVPQAKVLLNKAIELHQGHMNGTIPTSDSSQRKLMGLIENALSELDSKKSGAIMKEYKGVIGKHIKDMMGMGGADYARSEAWDCHMAAQALAHVCEMCMNETHEPDDMRSLVSIMRGLMEFMNGEMDEMVKAASQGDGYEKKVPAQVKESNLNLSYVKSLHLDTIPELAVKFVAKDEIKGYSNLWGDANKVDLEQEYFTKSTNFWDNKPQWLTWDHAQDDEFKSDPRIGEIVEIGDDEWGKWYVAKLKKAEAYRKYLDMLIADKKVGSSSDSAPQYVKRVKTGKSIWLSEWPLFAVSLTDNPCEPRMIGSIDFLKSLGIALPDVSNKTWEAEKAKLLYLRNKYT